MREGSTRPRSSTIQNTKVPEVAPAEIPASPIPVASENSPAYQQPMESVVPVESPTQASVRMIKYQVKHWHSLGSCSGEMTLTPQSIEFTSEQHIFKFDIKDVRLDKDGILDPSGRAWHFFMDGTDVEQVLSQWKKGVLFTGLSQSESPAISSVKEPMESAARVYVARHKHLLGSCSGELILTIDALEFSSKEHYIKSYAKTTQVEGDGILDRTGKAWRFDIQGEDAGALFRSWKNGTLFQ